MTLAHGATGSGPDLEILIFAAALVVLGVALFVQRAAPPAVAVVVALAGAVFGSGAFTFLAAEPPAPLMSDVCAFADAARAGQDDQAAAIFSDRVHGPLHELADGLSDQDRSAAARLLRAKQAIETEPGAADGAEVQELVDAVHDGLETSGEEPGGCG